jgi:hypothetical protein
MKMVGIDTVTLLLDASQFVVFEPSRFTPNATKVLGATLYDLGQGKFMPAVCNPTKKDTAAFGYLPYLTLFVGLRSGGLSKILRIQFSAPKLLKGNNFDELEEADFEQLCQQLLDGLAYYKVRIFGGLETLKNAQCQVVHYSKNFILPNMISTNWAITEIKKCDVNAWKSVSQEKYAEGGHGYKTHSKHYELAFYDKIAEHFKGKRGQPHYDPDIKQLSFDLFGKVEQKQLPEVLRMEVRYGRPQKLKDALQKARLPTDDLSFKTIFQQEYSQRVLISELEDYYSRFPNIAASTAKDEVELLSDLFVQNPDRYMSTIVSAVGIYTLTQKAGLRELKDIVGNKGSQAFLRLAHKASKELKYKADKPEVLESMMAALNEFQPVHLADFLE